MPVMSKQITVEGLRSLTMVWNLIKDKLNINCKRALVILLMDDLKSYHIPREFMDPRAMQLWYMHEASKERKTDPTTTRAFHKRMVYSKGKTAKQVRDEAAARLATRKGKD